MQSHFCLVWYKIELNFLLLPFIIIWSVLWYYRGCYFCWNSAISASGNGRYLSTDSNKVDEPLKVEEAETVNVPPPPTEKVQAAVNLLVCLLDGSFVCFLAFWLTCNLIQLLVLGGNGFVGSHICREALDRGLTVASLSRYWTHPMVVGPLKALILAFIIIVYVNIFANIFIGYS